MYVCAYIRECLSLYTSVCVNICVCVCCHTHAVARMQRSENSFGELDFPSTLWKWVSLVSMAVLYTLGSQPASSGCVLLWLVSQRRTGEVTSVYHIWPFMQFSGIKGCQACMTRSFTRGPIFLALFLLSLPTKGFYFGH